MFFHQTFSKLWERLLTPIDDPGSRLFHVNILATLALILIWALFSKNITSPRAAWPALKRLVLRKSYWWNTSTRVDYKVYFLNALLKVSLFIPLFELSYIFSKWTVKGLLKLNGDFASLSPTWMAMFAFTAFAFIWDDFLRFFHHWLMHKVPGLWSFHKLHHSARVLTPITLFRTHPLESAISTVRNSLSLGVLVGAFIFLFESQFSVLTLFGVNLFGGLFNFLGANLRHSHIPLSFGPLDYIFISPRQHQLHHSRNAAHFDSNFGVSLTLWDHLFGSFKLAKNEPPFKFGIEEKHSSSFASHLIQPFAENYQATQQKWGQLKESCKRPEPHLIEEAVESQLTFK